MLRPGHMLVIPREGGLLVLINDNGRLIKKEVDV